MIHETASYTVPSSTVEACRKAIQELIRLVQQEHDGIVSYLVLEDGGEQETRFLHMAVYEDRQSRRDFHESSALRDFMDLVYPATRDGITYSTQRVVDRVAREPVRR